MKCNVSGKMENEKDFSCIIRIISGALPDPLG